MKKIIAFSAALTLFISAVSCTKNTSDSDIPTADIVVSQTMYKEERISMPENMRSYLGGEFVEDSGVRLCFADDKGDVYYSDYGESGEFTPPELIFSADGHCETYASVCPDGSIALLVMTVISEGELYTEEYFANAKSSFEIRRYAPNGTFESSVDADELNRYFDISENDVILGFYAVNDSYVVSFGGGHILIGSDGFVENTDSDFSRMGFAADASGKVCSASRDGFVCGDSVELSIPENARKFGEYLTLQQGIRTGHDGFGLFFLLNDGVFGLTEKGDIVEILDYADSLASCADQYDVIYAGTGKFLAVGHNDIGTYLSVFTVRPDDYKMERRDVIVGTDHGEWGDYNDLISSYNKKSDSYFAKVKNYGEELDGLKAAILSGDPPDLYIYTDPEYMHRLVNIGAAADMYALSEKYGGFRKEDILDNIIKAYEYKNGLYMMSQKFELSYVSGNRGLFQKPDMTQAEFIDIVKNMPEGMTLTSAPQCTSPELFFEFLCDWKLQDWVNAEAAECYFDTPQFIEILELTMTAPLAEPIDFEELDRDTTEEGYKVLMNERMHSTILGKSLFSIGHGITSYHDFPFLNDSDSEKTIFINAPSEHPAGQLRAYEYFSVINGGGCTEGGWDLMNYAVSDEFLTSDLNTLYSFVTRKDTFEKITRMHRRWSEEPPDEGERRGGFCLTYDKPITDGEMAEYRNMIDKSTVLYGTSTAIKSILTEEYAQFAAGEITAEVCAERMQDRVTIYLSENL